MILDPERTEVRYNGEWLVEARPTPTSCALTRTMTVARLLERDDFAKRYAAGHADLGLRAPLPADAGVRLGRDRGGRRARRHRPALQPARRARGDGGLRPRAAGRADDAAPPLVGRREDELVGRQQHPADGGRPRSSSAGRCGSPTSSSPQWYRARRWSSRRPAGDPMEAKLELARFIVARSHGEEAARRGRGALHARRARGQAPEEVPEVDAAGRRPGAPAGAARGAPRRRLDERGAPPDRAGRGEGGRRAGHRARRARGRRSTERSSRPASAASCASALLLDSPWRNLCYHPAWLPERAAARSVPSLDTGAPFGRIGYDLGTESSEASGASRRLFVAGSWSGAVFENSTACVYVETSRRLRCRGAR